MRSFAHWLAKRLKTHPTRSPASRTGLGPLNALWAQFAAEVRDWRCIWLSQGVTDTAL